MLASNMTPSDEDLAVIDELDDALTAQGASGDRRYRFDDMRLKVGDRLQLQFPTRVAHERTFVRLIGYVSNQGLLVMAPRQNDGLRIHLHEGDELVVRVFSSQSAFGFSSRIDKIIKLPFEYLHLAFPKEIRGMQVRKSPRVKTRIICLATTATSGDNNLNGLLTNMSANGALLAAKQMIAPVGETIRLAFRFNLHGTEALMNLSAVVRSQFADENPKSRTPEHHGLEFVGLSSSDAMLLQSMIYQQMIEQPDTLI